jgi:hypothetical protein
MPFAPLRPCSFPLCPKFSPCPVHSRNHRGRGTTTQQGYGAAHQRLRIQCFERDGWKCRACGWEPDTVIDYRRFEIGKPPAAEVLEELRKRHNDRQRHLHADHVIPVEIRSDLRTELSNMQTLCDLCHGGKTNRERAIFNER